MAVLKYKDSNGQFVELTSLAGPQGPQGPKGDKGDKGDSGGIQDVYESATKGYISVKEANGNVKNVPVGDPNALLTTGGTMTGAINFANKAPFPPSSQ